MMKKSRKSQSSNLPKTPSVQGDSVETDDRQGMLDAILRDLNGLEQLQLYQRTLLKEVRQNLQALHPTSPS